MRQPLIAAALLATAHTAHAQSASDGIGASVRVVRPEGVEAGAIRVARTARRSRVSVPIYSTHQVRPLLGVEADGARCDVAPSGAPGQRGEWSFQLVCAVADAYPAGPVRVRLTIVPPA